MRRASSGGFGGPPLSAALHGGGESVTTDVDGEEQSTPTNDDRSCKEETATNMSKANSRWCSYAFTPKINTVSLIFLMSTCFWIFLLISNVQEGSYIKFIQNEAIRDIGKDPRYAELYRKNRREDKDLKYILLWTRNDFHPFYVWGEGQRVFLDYGCPVADCYVTANRRLFNDNLTQFDAVVFNGRNIGGLSNSQLPNERSPQQMYIFFCEESAHYFPVCKNTYDNFFNWTATYRLNSDIPFPYISIKNSAGEHVGPKINMQWMNKTSLKRTTYEQLYPKVKRKTKAAAWFVSNCKDKSHRLDFAKQLQKSLDVYGLQIDIYGSCGTHKCNRDNPDCSTILEKDYYFYLSFENSFSEDYVTEKLLTALDFFTIPIVYGGADYSRFLPPSSYIDGNTMSTADMAALMHRLIQSPQLYLQYMWWRDHYSYRYSLDGTVCDLCAALHNETLLGKRSVYTDFRRWWNPNYLEDCIRSAH